MFGGDRLAVMMEGHQRVLGQKIGERQVGGPLAVIAVRHHIRGFGESAAGLPQRLSRGHAFKSCPTATSA
jgi:hypothetical protein